MATGITMNNSARSMDLSFLTNSSGTESVEVRDAHGFKIGDGAGLGVILKGSAASELTVEGKTIVKNDNGLEIQDTAGNSGGVFTRTGTNSSTFTGSLAVTSTFTVAGSSVTTAGNSAFKNPVRAATTSNITLSGAQTIDGVSVVAGDRVLVKNQTTGANNGLYLAASGAWSRTTDADVSSEVTAGLTVFVSEGTVNGNSNWQLSTDDPITLGTTSLVFFNPSTSSAFSGDVASTSQGYLSDSSGSNPVTIRDDNGLKIANGANSFVSVIKATGSSQLRILSSLVIANAGDTLGAEITASAAAELTVNGSLVIQQDPGLVLKNTAGTSTSQIVSRNNRTVAVGVLAVSTTTANTDGGEFTATATGLNLNGSLVLNDDAGLTIKDDSGAFSGVIKATASSQLRTLVDTFVIANAANSSAIAIRATGSPELTFDGKIIINRDTGLEIQDGSSTAFGRIIAPVGAGSQLRTLVDTLAVANAANTNAVGLRATGNPELTIDGKLIVNRDTGLEVTDGAGTGSGRLLVTVGAGSQLRAVADTFVIENAAQTAAIGIRATASQQLTFDGAVIVARDNGLTIKNTAATASVQLTATSTSLLNIGGTVSTTGGVTATAGFSTPAGSTALTLTGGGTVVTTSNGDITFSPNGTGRVKINSFHVLDTQLPWKTYCKAATTANLAATRTSNVLTASANGAIPAIDGVSLVLDDRVLVKDQTTGADNGIYFVSDAGSGGTPYTLTRTLDADTAAEVGPGMTTFISQGTVNGNKTYQMTSDSPVLNTGALVFADINASASSFSGDLNATSDGFLSDSSGDLRIIGNASSNVVVKLGDNAGSRNFQITDSSNVLIFQVDSTGGTSASNGLTTGNSSLITTGLFTPSITLNTGSGNTITTQSNSDIALNPNGTGKVTTTATTVIANDGGLFIKNTGSTISSQIIVAAAGKLGVVGSLVIGTSTAMTTSGEILATAANELTTTAAWVVKRDAGFFIKNTSGSDSAQIQVNAGVGGIILSSAGTNGIVFTSGGTLTTTSNGDIALNPNGTGKVTTSASVVLSNNGGLVIKNTAGTQTTTLTATSTNTLSISGDVSTTGNLTVNQVSATSSVSATGGFATANGASALVLTGGGVISTTANGTIDLSPNGTGIVRVGGLYPVRDSRNPWKDSVRAATTANLAATRTGSILTATGNGALAAQDGVSLTTGDRILIKNQTTGADNGIYTVSSLGSGITTFSFTRAADFDDAAEVSPGAVTFVSEGTVNGNHNYQLTTDGPITLNTTSLTFSDAASSSTFSGDVASTTQGYLSDSSGSNPVEVRDANGFKISNGSGNTGTITATGATGLTTTADITIRNDSGLTLWQNGGTPGGTISPNALGELTVSASNALRLSTSSVVIGGSFADITTTTNQTLTISANGSGQLQLNKDAVYVGTGSSGTDIYIYARNVDSNKPFVRFNDTLDMWEISNDGVNAYAIYNNTADYKASCRVATTANITLSGTQTIDGVSVIAGNRVLVKNQTTAANNGIYVCAAGAWSRSTDADSDAEVTTGMTTHVSEGTTNADTDWKLTTNDPITLGTTSLVFTSFSPSSSFSGDLNSTSLGKLTDSSGDLVIEGNASSNIVNKLGDSAGARSFKITDSSNASQFTIDSDGVAFITTSLDVNGTTQMDSNGVVSINLTSNNLAVAGSVVLTDGAGMLVRDNDLMFTGGDTLQVTKISGRAGVDPLIYRGDPGMEWSDGAGLIGMKLRVLSVQTTDATFTTLQVNTTDIIVPDGEVHTFTAYITGRVSSGAHIDQGVYYRLEVAVRGDSGGTPVIIGTDLKTIIAEDTNLSAYDVQVTTTTGDTVLFQVKGEASNTVDWRAWITETALS